MGKQLVCPDSGKRMSASRLVLSAQCPACGEFVRLTDRGCLRRHAPKAGSAERQQAAVDAIKEWKAKGRDR